MGKKKTIRRINECSTCRGVIEENRVKSKQKLCNSCQRQYTRDYRKKRNYLTIGNNQKEKHYARTTANTYLRRGKIIKQPCSVCGHVDTEMHHEDYSKPLEIVWFCRKHHIEHHKNNENVF